jgi:hypothetical protein
VAFETVFDPVIFTLVISSLKTSKAIPVKGHGGL